MPLGTTTHDRTTSTSILLKKVVNWDGKSQDIYQALTAAFGAKDYLHSIKNLQAHDIEPLSYIDGLDKVCVIMILRQHDSFNNDWEADYRQPASRFRPTEAMRTCAEKNVWIIWSPSYFARNSLHT